MDKKYSDWLRIDLHIHTDWSAKTKDNDYKGVFTVAKLREKLIFNNVKIFSLTDHNIINEKAYEDYYRDYNSMTDPLLLLGVELDISINSKVYHAIIVFNCDDIQNVRIINTRLEKKYIEKNQTDYRNRFLTLEDIVGTFWDNIHVLIVHADGDKNIVEAYKNANIKDAQKMILLMYSALEKVTKEERIVEYNKRFTALLSDSFNNRPEDIPYINFSDNHCIESYPCRHKGDNNSSDHEFYYIKGSKCFESIRLAFIDPESRIKTTQQYNEINHLNNTIDFLKIENDNTIVNNELSFSPHLNVIIGGRSSGKSMLMWLLGKKINYLNYDNKYTKVEPNKVFIKSKKDASYTLETSQNQFIYIKQGDIIDYFEKGNLKDLANKSNKSDEYEKTLSGFRIHKEKLTKVQEDYIQTYKLIHESNISKSFILHNKTLDSLLSKHYIFRLDSLEIKNEFDITEKITSAEKSLNTLVTSIEELYKLEVIELDEKELNITHEFEKILRSKQNLILSKKEKNAKINSFIDSVSDIKLKTNSKLDLEAKEKEQSRIILESFKMEIKSLFNKTSYLKEKADALELFDCSYKGSFQIEDKISLALEANISNNLKDLILEGIFGANFNDSLFINTMNLLYKVSSVKHLTGNDPAKLNQKISTQLKICYETFESPKDYLQYEDGETSKEKSPGYNSEKYLEIILKNPKSNIIFIDQPEDNLGNNFIAKALVPIIRKIKFNKQIFLVTHNPSIVVYGDAESIILAKNDNNSISYEQIVLESPDAQKEICSILDGGEYIFHNRSKKYNIQRILKN
jgi:predicted ATPase